MWALPSARVCVCVDVCSLYMLCYTHSLALSSPLPIGPPRRHSPLMLQPWKRPVSRRRKRKAFILSLLAGRDASKDGCCYADDDGLHGLESSLGEAAAASFSARSKLV